MNETNGLRVASLLLMILAGLVLFKGMGRVPVPDGPPMVPSGWRVELMEASSQELQLLPGIGPVLAARIVSWRVEGGNLDRLEDLQRIRGIGRRTIESLQPLVSVAAFSLPGEFKNED